MSHDSHDKFGKMDEANRAAIAEQQRRISRGQRPVATLVRWIAFLVGALLCWLYAETLATVWANGYDGWMKIEQDLWFGIDHFLLGGAIGITMLVVGGFMLVRTNGDHRLLIIATSALWMVVAFVPLAGAIVLLNQWQAR